MIIVTLLGGVTQVKVLKMKTGRELLEIRLVASGYGDTKTYWKCHSYQPQHMKLISWLPTGRQILLQDQVYRIESFMTKDNKPASNPVLRIDEIVFLPKDDPSGYEALPEELEPFGT